jgi:hypothetical protein
VSPENQGSFAVDEKLSIDHSGLDAIKKKEVKESPSLFYKNEAKD